jgi:hypothetical protein
MIAVNCGKRFIQSLALVFDSAPEFPLLVPRARTASRITPNYDHAFGDYVVTGA